MFRSREDIDESTEYQVKPALGVLLRQVGNRGLFSNNRFQLRDQTHYQLSVRIERFLQGTAPRVQLLFAFIQQWSDEAPKGLREGGVRNIALVLVELARSKKPARRNQRFV